MFRDKFPDLEDPHESEELLLAEEENISWGVNEGNDDCSSFTKSFLWFTALSVFFMSGTLFGFFWRGDLDGLCSEHTSQYCMLANEVTSSEFY